MSSHSRDLLIDGAKATPVLGTAFAHWVVGIDWQPWVLLLTLIYTVFLVGEKLFKFGKWLRKVT